jgi:DNA topoisomerase IB
MQAENVEMQDDNHIKFDFLGKDSIKYENTVKVAPEVWRNMKAFKRSDRNGNSKGGPDQLFDAMNAQVLPLIWTHQMLMRHDSSTLLHSLSVLVAKLAFCLC